MFAPRRVSTPQCLTEDVVSVVLQLVEEEQKKRGVAACAGPLAVQVAACIVALCGWAARSDHRFPPPCQVSQQSVYLVLVILNVLIQTVVHTKS